MPSNMHKAITMKVLLKPSSQYCNCDHTVRDVTITCTCALMFEKVCWRRARKRRARQLQLVLLAANMGSLLSKMAFMVLFLYFSYKVWTSIGKFQRQGDKTFTVYFTESVLPLILLSYSHWFWMKPLKSLD